MNSAYSSKEESEQRYGATETYSNAEMLLPCSDASIVPELIRRRFLTTVSIGTSKRISRKSIDAFANQYMALSVIAANMGTSARALMRWCKERKVFMLIIRRRSLRQAFVRREDIAQIHKIHNDSPSNDHVLPMQD